MGYFTFEHVFRFYHPKVFLAGQTKILLALNFLAELTEASCMGLLVLSRFNDPPNLSGVDTSAISCRIRGANLAS